MFLSLLKGLKLDRNSSHIIEIFQNFMAHFYTLNIISEIQDDFKCYGVGVPPLLGADLPHQRA